ncbi:hypothetical protein BKA67DRAFT_649924 [Truncatella angustata]|uniref:Rhodopsin domain-containing protein n=1 Tax=Truncatella angustata TaxID=152316 RepID=A0A9P8UCG2_9PEZI|nr:uncharacterized protein BKA67DRAFT_649924 [Truncatella angustata]KAH6646656.1 hypothetical protein BKA67DRAFT_649924 [Truncatella angustata]
MYDDPSGLIAASVILWLLTVLCVALRFSLKLHERQPLRVSDWLILASWLFGTGLTVLEIYGIAIKSLGYRIGATLIDPASVTGQLNKAKHIQLAFLLLGITALGLIKLSVCFLYWQLFAQISSRTVLRRFLIVWMVVITAWATSFVLAGLLECGSHLSAVFGTPTEYLEHCGGAVSSGYAMVGTDIATDFITLIIPIPIILGLHMDMHRKLLTLSAFLIGALSVGASVAKGYIYIQSSLGQYTEDGLLILTGLSIWNLAEVQVGIIAACGPLLRPFISRLFTMPSFISSRVRSTSKMIDSKESRDSRRFQQIAESEVELAIRDRSMSQAPSDRSRLDTYGLGARYKSVSSHLAPAQP